MASILSHGASAQQDKHHLRGIIGVFHHNSNIHAESHNQSMVRSIQEASPATTFLFLFRPSAPSSRSQSGYSTVHLWSPPLPTKIVSNQRYCRLAADELQQARAPPFDFSRRVLSFLALGAMDDDGVCRQWHWSQWASCVRPSASTQAGQYLVTVALESFRRKHCAKALPVDSCFRISSMGERVTRGEDPDRGDWQFRVSSSNCIRGKRLGICARLHLTVKSLYIYGLVSALKQGVHLKRRSSSEATIEAA